MTTLILRWVARIENGWSAVRHHSKIEIAGIAKPYAQMKGEYK
jgi:hypothetical protein